MDLTGLALAQRYYQEVVAPLLLDRWPGLPHAGARLGSGSDVLGLDDETSRDHDWGLRLTVLVDGPLVAGVDEYLAGALPDAFLGLPTRFATTWEPVVRHRVQVDTPAGFAASRIGVAPDAPLDVVNWLALTGQSVLEVTSGAVFTDTHGGLTRIRELLAWYPDDLWHYTVAADWARLAEELPFVGRTGDRGDDVGSRVLAARLAEVAMHLGFLLERRWPPYPKWLGTVFASLPRASAALPGLRAALAADGWQPRQEGLADALRVLHELQRQAGLPSGDGALEPFYDRGFLRVRDDVPGLLLAGVTDPAVRALAPGVGSVEQWVHNVDVLSSPQRRLAAARAVRP